jgi:hypothetical protein
VRHQGLELYIATYPDPTFSCKKKKITLIVLNLKIFTLFRIYLKLTMQKCLLLCSILSIAKVI